MKKILFLVKSRTVYDEGSGNMNHLSSGLYNSALKLVEALNGTGYYDAKLVNIIDGNSIDREVTLFKPDVCVLEAFFCTPAKLAENIKLHPKVTFLIRNHSDFAFLANEGCAVDWSLEYLKFPGVYLAPNSIDTYMATVPLVEAAGLNSDQVVYLPNIYDPPEKVEPISVDKSYINIGCFGAIRPLKNQLMQAIAAIEFGEFVDMPIRFHINSNRIEMNGNPILKNIRALFAHQTRHQLVEHSWMDHSDFLKVVAAMDIGMQVAYSETFNIVTADMLSQEIPSVVSSEIFWCLDMFKADPNSVRSMVDILLKIYQHKTSSGLLDKAERYILQKWFGSSLGKLKEYNRDALNRWEMFLE